MSEKILWFILSIVALLFAVGFLLVEQDPIRSGATALICLCILQFRAQATS